jgi:vacuolar-type H+-ATPase subunit D/Vma8
MTLTEEEIVELKNIVSDYNRCDGEINAVKTELLLLKQKHDNLAAEIKTIEEQEKAFLQKLNEKYGRVSIIDLASYL